MVSAFLVMAFIVMAFIAMVFIVMAYTLEILRELAPALGVARRRVQGTIRHLPGRAVPDELADLQRRGRGVFFSFL